nr:monodehydroascorbate reductase [Tanacetum cinerariifolium]
MADVNVNAPAGQAPTMAPPVRTDDQILPQIRWVPIGKSNCYLDLDKSQSNPIYKITVDILKHTNFFRAFTASSTIPSIYIQQLWDTIQYNKSAGCYRCHLDEQWFDLTKDTLREALQITPVNNNQAFTSPPSSDALINFVNELGYPKLTTGFERLRAPVLQILRGVFTQTHIDYAERIWEEFTQSIHTFIDDKRNLHKFHPRPDSPLHLPNEEPVLGYLKFSAKGTKREVFGMPIPSSLITTDIQEASYYQEYLAKVAKHQRKPKSTVPKVPPRPSVSKPVSSTQPEPKSTPAKTQGKKRKLTTETSGKPFKAIKSRHSFVSKKCKPISPLRSVDESVAEDVPAKEPQVADEEADVQKELEESIKSIYDVPQGPLPPVVIREPESEKYQPLPKVPRKGKAKVTEEQVAHDLLNLQKPKRKSLVDQYIFQRRTSIPTGSFGHDESSFLYAELGLSDSEEESQEVVPGADAGGQGEGQAGPELGAQAKGQAGPDPSAQDEGQAGSNPDKQSEGLAGPDPEQMDEGFTATTYSKVQENLKLTVEEQVLLEEPASSSGTLSSLQHLSKDLSFGDLFFSDKPLEADNDKATAKTEVESMVFVTIQQDMSLIPPMTSSIIDLTSRPESLKVHQQLKATAIETTTRTTTTTSLPLPYQQQQSTTDAMRMKRIGDLEHIMANLIQENKKLKQRLDNHGACLYILEQLDIPHQVSKAVNEVVTDAVDWDMQAPLRNRFRDLPEADLKEILHQLPPPPPPPLSTNQESPSKGFVAPSSSKTAASAEYQAWMMTDIRLRPSISLTPADLQMDEDIAPDEQSQSSDDEDIRTLVSNYSPPPEDSLLAQTSDIAMLMDWFCKRRGITDLKPQDLEGPAFKIIKVFHPVVIHLQYQMEECYKLLTDSVDDSILRHNVSKPLPLGGPPGQVTIQSDFFFNKDLKYLRYGSKGSRPALSILKMKAAYYPDVSLQQMVPDQIWIEDECKYNIAAMYCISH